MAKKTLNIFHSDFLMRANLKEKELVLQKKWKEMNLIALTKKGKTKKFIFHSGPPYANGNIHIGHALNKILKDFVLRYFSLKGFAVEYKPGWDTHGLPIATAVTKKYPQIKFNQNPIQFRELCLNYAREQIDKQILQFERLGLLIDFSNRYLTSDFQYVAKQLTIFSDLVEQKLIFYALKPVLWSWSSQTALAETEIIYEEKETNSIFVSFPLISDENNSFFQNIKLLVWTTAIWTIPENKLLSINQDEEYVKFPFQSFYLVVAKKCLKHLSFIKQIDLKKCQFFKGTKLLKIQYSHPYLNFTSQIVHSEHVSMTEGTGAVHISPAHGTEDYDLAQKFKIPFQVALDEKGVFNSKSTDKDLIGKFYQTAQTIILDKLKKSNSLIQEKIIIHSYPHDWRTNKPVFFRATPQWYLDLTKSTDNLLDKIKQIQWMPKWAQKRMQLNLANRKDWCLSRQRSWGVPIPIFFNKNHKPILNAELIKTIILKIQKHGDQIWWKWNLDKLLTKEQIIKHQIINKSQDTMDVWFDSGCSAQILFPIQKKEAYIDFIWEGNDQFRGWFNSLLMLFWSSKKHDHQIVKKVLAHGFVNDEKGLKMSKSKGNTIDPLTICKTLGADVIRMWVVSSDFYADINLSNNLINKFAQDYLKTRNTIRFLINNLMDFDYRIDFQSQLENLDLILLFKFDNLITELTKDFDKQEFHNGWIKLFQFINKDLSAFYFVFAKKILYEKKLETLRRRQVQTTLNIVLEKLLILLAPFIPHTAEEAYNFFKKVNKKQSIHLEIWPKEAIYKFSSALKEKILFQSQIFENTKKELHQILQKEKIKKINNLKLVISIAKNTKVFNSLDEWKKICKKFYSNLPDFAQTNNLLNPMNNFYENLDLKDFLEVQEVIVNFYDPVLSFKPPFIKIQTINNVD